MKNKRIIVLVAATLSILIFSNVFNLAVSTSRFNESYPAVVCPPNTTGLSTAISLTSPKTLVRKTGTSSMKTSPVGFRRYAVAAQSAVIEAGPVTPVVWQVRKGVWAGAVPCGAAISSQWFVGATADVTSKGSLTIVNSGLGKALVGVTVFTENGVQAEQVFAVKANSFITTQLASLAPGSKSIAIHVVPQTGRVNAFVTDERGRGLQALGGDTVNPVENATKSLVIPAVPQQTGKKTSLPHTLRILIPGEVGAQIGVEIKSTDGTFSPAGIDGKMIPAGKVVDLPLDVIMQSGKFALHLTADRPFVASVFTKTQSQGKTDFLWSTGVPELQNGTFATTGLAPLLVFTGDEISVDLELTSIAGKKQKITVRGSDIATYQISERTRSFTVTKRSAQTYGAALIASKSGFGYAPLVTGSVLTRTSIPRSNIRVLIP